MSKWLLILYRGQGYKDRYQARKAMVSSSAIPVRQKSKKRVPAQKSMPVFAAPMIPPMAMMYPPPQEEEEEDSEEDEMVRCLYICIYFFNLIF